jgi:long-chain acyl-CoA synthetase
MLTHENVVASMSAVLMQMGDHKVKSSDVLISFLPLAHMLERCCEVLFPIARRNIDRLF